MDSFDKKLASELLNHDGLVNYINKYFAYQTNPATTIYQFKYKKDQVFKILDHTEEEFIHLLRNCKIEPDRTPIANIWLKHPDRRQISKTQVKQMEPPKTFDLSDCPYYNHQTSDEDTFVQQDAGTRYKNVQPNSFHYVYLVEQLDAHDGAVIFKFGKTTRRFDKRMYEYYAQTKPLLILEVENCHKYEKSTLKILKKDPRIEYLPDRGNEFFKCLDRNYIKRKVLKTYYDYCLAVE